MNFIKLLAPAMLAILASTAAYASTAASGKIVAGTTYKTDNAFQFFNDSTEGEYITSLTWDLTPIGGFFDTTNAAPGIDSSGLLQSVLSSDVGAVFPTNADQDGKWLLMVNFAPNSFAAGEAFIFGVDTDFLSCIDCVGINGFGFVGATASATFSNGQTRNGTYVVSNQAGFASQVSITAVTPPTAVPEPESYALMLAGLGLMGAVVRRRNQSKAA